MDGPQEKKRKSSQTNDSYRFKIGKFNCIIISDGTLTYSPPIFPTPANLLFANAEQGELTKTLRKHNLDEKWNEWVSPYLCLVVDTGENLVLVDTGAGNLGSNTGKLPIGLAANGISPKNIDTVILTHGHPDHIGGTLTIRGKPAFPNARFFMCEDEWNFWSSGQARLKLGHGKEVLIEAAHRNLPPIRDQLNLVEKDSEVIPGVSTVAAFGHTVGHMALVVSSMGENLLCVADAFLHPIHVEHPDWWSVVDYDPLMVAETRRKLLGMCGGGLVFAFHFPFPGLGNFVHDDGVWRWKPIKEEKTSGFPL